MTSSPPSSKELRAGGSKTQTKKCKQGSNEQLQCRLNPNGNRTCPVPTNTNVDLSFLCINYDFLSDCTMYTASLFSLYVLLFKKQYNSKAHSLEKNYVSKRYVAEAAHHSLNIPTLSSPAFTKRGRLHFAHNFSFTPLPLSFTALPQYNHSFTTLLTDLHPSLSFCSHLHTHRPRLVLDMRLLFT